MLIVTASCEVHKTSVGNIIAGEEVGGGLHPEVSSVVVGHHIAQYGMHAVGAQIVKV